jgi:hypothetical protein
LPIRLPCLQFGVSQLDSACTVDRRLKMTMVPLGHCRHKLAFATSCISQRHENRFRGYCQSRSQRALIWGVACLQRSSVKGRIQHVEVNMSKDLSVLLMAGVSYCLARVRRSEKNTALLYYKSYLKRDDRQIIIFLFYRFQVGHSPGVLLSCDDRGRLDDGYSRLRNRYYNY